MSSFDYTTDEMMTVEAARQLSDGDVCFVGIGLPSAAANLARLTHAPQIVLIYESGTIGAKPNAAYRGIAISAPNSSKGGARQTINAT